MTVTRVLMSTVIAGLQIQKTWVASLLVGNSQKRWNLLHTQQTLAVVCRQPINIPDI